MDRRKTVDAARARWIDRLIDLTRRNSLLYFRELKSGTLDVTAHDPAQMVRFLKGETVYLSKLLPSADEAKVAAALRGIRHRAVYNLEEKGLDTLFLAYGMATWDDGSGPEARPPEAAVYLVPVEIAWRGRAGQAASIVRKGDVQPNEVLLHVLDAQLGARVDPAALFDADGDGEEDADFLPAFERLEKEVAGAVKGFRVSARAVIGNFAFQKMAMVRDLQDRGREMAEHDLVAAVAGDLAARAAHPPSGTVPDPAEADRVPPDEEFQILDADSSQQRVIRAALAGRHLVIQGPPGTGKSQTIANLISEMAARGRKVLFVAEKRAALEAVLKRLEAAGLGHLALDLHGADLSKRKVMSQVAESLRILRQTPPVDAAEVHRELADRRDRLNAHVERIHAPRAPSGLSVYEMLGRLLRHPADARAETRWRGADLDRLDAQAVRKARDLLAEAGGFGGLFLRNDPSPWNGARLEDGEAAQSAMDRAAELAADAQAIARDAAALAAEAGARPPATAQEALELAEDLASVARILDLYPPELFARDLDAVRAALAPAAKGGLVRLFAGLLNGAYRAALKEVSSLRREPPASPGDLLREAGSAASARNAWARWRPSEGALPRPAPAAGPFLERAEAFGSALAALDAAFDPPRLSQAPLAGLPGLLSALRDDGSTPHRLPRLVAIEGELERLGAGALVAELRAKSPDPPRWGAWLDHAWLSSCLDKARREDPAIGGFNGATHERFVEQFRRLDAERIRLARDRVRRAHAEHAFRTMNERGEEAALVRREAEKKTRHLPLRRLLAEAPEVLTSIRPCWMASPLSVSQLLDADRRYFDAVVFDEASQILPQDAVPAFLRASQAIVAGDQRQLPPTTFFAAGEGEGGEGEDPAAVEGFESMLDLMASFIEPTTLDWHYRSRDESLIAFSNRHIYGSRLVTFPSPGGAQAVRHVLVDEGGGGTLAAGQEESGDAEVRRVVELALEHARARPDESLGVIAMGILHADRVERALEEALRWAPDVEPFFDPGREERFFVKNLERVQGDERDAILLTVGYGKDASGRLPYRFGPLLTAGGERRLNVAVTRARRRMTVVSSFSHRDMDPKRSAAKGVELLRAYLAYAAGEDGAGRAGGEGLPLSALEEDVAEALAEKGLRLTPRFGASRLRIDLAVGHPEAADRHVLAVELDGPGYRALPTARDRDRLRRQQLEALGWRHLRVWGPDWFARRDAEAERIVKALREAVAEAGRRAAGDGGGASTPAAKPPAAASPAASPATRRARRPAIMPGRMIQEYPPEQLVALARWVRSDGLLRTDEELLGELMKELELSRRGSRIEEALRDAIRRSGEAPAASS